MKNSRDLGWFWAGFGLVDNTEKNGADYEQLLTAVFFSCFQGQKKVILFRNVVSSALKSCKKC